MLSDRSERRLPTATANNNTTSFVATGLTNTGLSINAAGVISGTPTTVGTFPVTLTATNATGTGTAVTLTIQIFATTPTLKQEYVVLHRSNRVTRQRRPKPLFHLSRL